MRRSNAGIATACRTRRLGSSASFEASAGLLAAALLAALPFGERQDEQRELRGSKLPLKRSIELVLEFDVTDMARGRLTEGEDDTLVLAGSKRFAVAETDSHPFELVRQGTLEDPPDLPYPTVMPVRLRDVDGDGDMEFVRPAEAWHPPVCVHDGDGSVLWHRYEPDGPEFTLDGDLNGDGRLEFLVGSSEGTILYSAEGEVLWRRDWNSSADPVLLEDAGGGAKIVFAKDDEVLLVSDDGQVEDSFDVPQSRRGFHNDLEVVRGFGGTDHPLVLFGAYVEGLLWGGRQVYALYDPSDGSVEAVERKRVEPYLESVTVRSGERRYPVRATIHTEQAPVAGFSNASLLVRVFDEADDVVYERWLQSTGVVTTYGLLAEEGSFLLAYGRTVWRFTFPTAG